MRKPIMTLSTCSTNINVKNNILFQGLSEEEINSVLVCSNSKIKEYKKNEIIFSQLDPPKALYLLLEGQVLVSQDSLEGRTFIICQIEENDIFGEVFLFLDGIGYSQYVIASGDSKVLEIPKEFFTHTCNNNCNAHSSIINNMLSILARKAFYLNMKVQLLTSGSLRQRLAKYFIMNMSDTGLIRLNMNRDSLSSYLNCTRPSLSRELMKMQEEGLIEADKDSIQVIDFDGLEEFVS